MPSAPSTRGPVKGSKMKGRVYERGSAAASMGAEAQQQHKKRRIEEGEEAKEAGQEEGEGEEAADGPPVAPPSDSDSETSEDDDIPPPPRPSKLPSRSPSIPSPSPFSSRPSPPSSLPSSSPRSTVSIAIPGSIIANAQSSELRSYLAGQIARAATVFGVDRVVVFRDSPSETREGDDVEGEWRGAHRTTDPSVFLARILQYLECPQYLRKLLFPVHADLRYAGLLNPLDAPHHVRATEYSQWREGVVVNRPAGAGGRKGGGGSWANVGLLHDIQIDRALPPLTRVTVRMGQDHTAQPPPSRLQGQVVSPERPREAGLYWGYEVEVCPSFSAVLSSCKWTDDGLYDLTIGTSERGRVIDRGDGQGGGFVLPRHRHLLVVFGGLNGLEEACASDEGVKETKVDGMFDLYLNTCQQQGSRSIRTEEAVLITLALLRPHILANSEASPRKGR